MGKITSLLTVPNKCFCDARSIVQQILDGLPIKTVIVDGNASIIFANRSFLQFCKKTDLMSGISCIGRSYLEIYDQWGGGDPDKIKEISLGIQKIANGRQKSLSLTFPYCYHNNKSLCRLIAYYFDCGKGNRIILSHFNATLGDKIIENINKQRGVFDKGKVVFEELRNKSLQYTRAIEQLVTFSDVIPNSEQVSGIASHSDLPQHPGNDVQEKVDFINMIQSRSLLPLTSQEIAISCHVLEGKNSKEISHILNISVATVSFHRKNIRQKLALQGKKINLRSALATLCGNEENTLH